tara:strand:- start:550 stop:879 length:330 start_codon:yes stop_codon:yes gene_type:complete
MNTSDTPTLRDLLGWAGPVDAVFIGHDWSLSPTGWQEKSTWEASKRSLLTMLPDGATLRADGGSVTIRRNSSGIPTLFTETDVAWLRLGSSGQVEGFFRHFDHAVVVTR